MIWYNSNKNSTGNWTEEIQLLVHMGYDTPWETTLSQSQLHSLTVEYIIDPTMSKVVTNEDNTESHSLYPSDQPLAPLLGVSVGTLIVTGEGGRAPLTLDTVSLTSSDAQSIATLVLSVESEPLFGQLMRQGMKMVTGEEFDLADLVMKVIV